MTTLYEEVRAALRELEFRPRKSRGQNFLVHERVIDAILRLVDLSPQDEVIEIGPGLGFLTRRLIASGANVWAVEVDGTLVDWLKRSSLSEHSSFHLLHDDILTAPLDELLPKHKIKLVGNLPYNISTAVLFRLFEWRDHFSSLVLMVQKEVAERMASGPGSKEYGTLSVWCQVHGQVTEKLSVSPEAFFPRPKVRSTVLKIELFPEPLAAGDELAALRNLVRAAFGQRRKTLGNALSGLFGNARTDTEAFLRSEDIDPQRRGETLSVAEFIRLARRARANHLLTTGK
ncbi:MAG: 16S rRNA (adenine(1518)-N(6)/adenine(1519)-N(6))-dimethyltransferase RsmA [Deltaproteobacteria bacterium]|nr:16S rRNA (adenine(1518)-N(6)/adenine(1519)-N(6))-dimethyltransferase RsmA [Deltaproteobacteria bacterium]MDZ4347859.1 16S rRNA (adenine(1518)-N(6)/adenine(1519)-N(6))-dimethyltransferase RsmA [Candidatus Binatia bacterium]